CDSFSMSVGGPELKREGRDRQLIENSGQNLPSQNAFQTSGCPGSPHCSHRRQKSRGRARENKGGAREEDSQRIEVEPDRREAKLKRKEEDSERIEVEPEGRAEKLWKLKE
ncbi:hypothetical protein CAPTEDRAFT_194229, partial [Capitella teleta]